MLLAVILIISASYLSACDFTGLPPPRGSVGLIERGLTFLRCGQRQDERAQRLELKTFIENVTAPNQQPGVLRQFTLILTPVSRDHCYTSFQGAYMETDEDHGGAWLLDRDNRIFNGAYWKIARDESFRNVVAAKLLKDVDKLTRNQKQHLRVFTSFASGEGDTVMECAYVPLSWGTCRDMHGNRYDLRS